MEARLCRRPLPAATAARLRKRADTGRALLPQSTAHSVQRRGRVLPR